MVAVVVLGIMVILDMNGIDSGGSNGCSNGCNG